MTANKLALITILLIQAPVWAASEGTVGTTTLRLKGPSAHQQLVEVQSEINKIDDQIRADRRISENYRRLPSLGHQAPANAIEADANSLALRRMQLVSERERLQNEMSGQE